MEEQEVRKEKMLLIVDPQIDFINGSLPIPGAEEAMNALAEYVKTHGKEYDCIVVTSDRHSIHHTSFKEFGGEWPAHCIKSSVGAAIWPPLMEALLPFHHDLLFTYKGEDPDEEEYSIFRSERGSFSTNCAIKYPSDRIIDEIDICGLAGDVCVAKTLEDAMELYPDIRFRILEPYTASLDGGKYVTEMNRMLDLLYDR